MYIVSLEDVVMIMDDIDDVCSEGGLLMIGLIGGASTISRSRSGGFSGGKYYCEFVVEMLYCVVKCGEGCVEVFKVFVDVRIIYGCLV